MPNPPEWMDWIFVGAYLVVLAFVTFLSVRTVRRYERRTTAVFEKFGLRVMAIEQELSRQRSYLMMTPEGEAFFRVNPPPKPCKHCGEIGVMFSSEGPDVWYCEMHGMALLRDQAEQALRRRDQNKALHGP